MLKRNVRSSNTGQQWKEEVLRLRIKCRLKESVPETRREIAAGIFSGHKQLRKGHPIRMIAENEDVGVSTVQRIKKKFVDNAE